MQKEVLIIPMQPTPNGRMHIGHGAGTYLRSDVLARALRIRGYSVSIISGSDAFENWIIAEAERIGKSPAETCDYYHKAIQEDLKSLDIEFDVWIDPRSTEHQKQYVKLHENVFKHLKENNNAYLEDERIPYSKQSGQAMTGAWISGKCPYCHHICQGSSCVYCGAHFQPEELLEPTSRLDNSTLEWKNNQNWFVKPKNSSEVISSLQKRGVKQVWMKAPIEYLEKGGRIRLSGPGTWGIRSELLPDGFVLSNPYYLYSVYCGEVYQKLNSQELNPFHPLSEVTVVGIFGSDNSTPGLVAPDVIAEGTEGLLKSFDMTIVNGMLFLEGQKCSTSKRHGIWLDEIQEKNTGITSDELRFFLSQAPLDQGYADISLEELINIINMYRNWSRTILIPTMQKISNQHYSIKDKQSLIDSLSKQFYWLEASQFDLSKVTQELQNWMILEHKDRATWLLGIALLSAPILPKLSTTIIRFMGLRSNLVIPDIENLEAHTLSFTEDMLGVDSRELSLDILKPFIHLAEVNV